MPVFAEVERSAIEWVVERADCVRYPQDAAIAKSGDPISHMSIIVSGTVKYFFDTNKGFQNVGSSGPR